MGKSYKRWEETGIYADAYELVKSGMAKKRNNYKRLMEYKELGLRLFGKYMYWNDKKQCFNMLPKYSFKNVLKRQYKLTI